MATACQDFDTLLAQAQQGDKAAQGELLDSLRGYLYLLSLRQMDGRLAKRLDPSDLVQETYVTALRSFEQFVGTHQAQFLAWLAQVNRHVVLNQARRHIHTEIRPIDRECACSCLELAQLAVVCDSTPSGKVMRGELLIKLAFALDSLPEDQREAVRLRYCESLPLAEIASHMQRSTQSIAGLLKRGLQTLRTRLGNDLW